MPLQLKPVDMTTFNEKHIMTPKERRELRVKMMNNIFNAMALGKYNYRYRVCKQKVRIW